jgi:serine/threonine protein kinase
MSPEGLLHNVYGPKTDVWAFGMLVYELLHGMSPFNFCQSENELKKAIKVPVNWDQLKATLPSSLKRLILKCLKVSVEERPKFSDLLTDEYIQKLYQHGAHSKADQKSNYSKNTSDSEKIYESVSLTLFNTNK